MSVDITDRKPKNLLEAAIRLEHEAQYWTGYDPSLITETARLAKIESGRNQTLVKENEKLSQQNRHDFWKRVAWIVGFPLVICIVTTTILFNNTNYENIRKEALKKELIEGTLSEQVLIDSGFEAVVNDGYTIYIYRNLSSK